MTLSLMRKSLRKEFSFISRETIEAATAVALFFATVDSFKLALPLIISEELQRGLGIDYGVETFLLRNFMYHLAGFTFFCGFYLHDRKSKDLETQK